MSSKFSLLLLLAASTGQFPALNLSVAEGADQPLIGPQTVTIAVLPAARTGGSSLDSRKPTSAAPVINDVVTLNWSLSATPSENFATQKAGRTASAQRFAQPEIENTAAVAELPRLQPTPLHTTPDTGQPGLVTAVKSAASERSALARRVPEVIASEPAAARPGVAKATVGPAPVPPADSLAMVTWTASTAASRDSKRPVAGLPFQAEACPVVSWTDVETDTEKLAVVSAATSQTSATPGTVVSANIPAKQPSVQSPATPKVVTAELPELQFVSSTSVTQQHQPALDPRDLAELRQLRTKAQEEKTIAVDESYLADLHALLQQPAPFLFINGAVLDLSPNEPDAQPPAYLQDLETLLTGAMSVIGQDASGRGYSSAVALSRYAGRDSFGPNSADENEKRYSIPAEPQCLPSGGSAISTLFQPINSIRLGGTSTSPPKVADNAVTTELQRPQNQACAYLESALPSYYLTATQFGVLRPNRQPHAFYHNPLYYEDPNLERCGQSSGCLTTMHSAVHFATMITLTPYLIGATPPCSCVQALPDCPTCGEFGCEAYFPAWSWKGAALQAAAVTGIIFIVP